MPSPATLEPLVLEAVLIPTDFSESDFNGIAHALRIALSAKGRLSYLHVGSKRTADVQWRDFPQTRKILAAWGVLPEEAGHDQVLRLGLSIRKSLRKGNDLAAELNGEIRKAGADMVVYTTRPRRGLLGRFRKSRSCDIARRLARPVLFVESDAEGLVEPETGAVRLENIVLASAPDLNPAPCLQAALGLALVMATGPVTVHVATLGEADEQIPYLLPKLPAGWKVQPVEVGGDLTRALLGVAEDANADLLVVPGFAPAGVTDRLRGTVTERILARAGRPVLMVPQ